MANVEKAEDALHVEAPAALQSYQNVLIDPAIEKRVVRKLDWNLMPLVVALCKFYLLSTSLAWGAHNL
jgi:hypothetical protein